MWKDICVWNRVTLTESMRKVCEHPEQYVSGTVTEIGAWNTCTVQFNGIPHPIIVRMDELVKI